MLRLSTGDELNNLPMPTVEVEVYHEWWEFDTDTFPPLLLLTFPHHGGILSWWEYAGKPLSWASMGCQGFPYGFHNMDLLT